MSANLLLFQIASSVDTIMAGLRYLDGAIRDEGFIADGSYSDIRLIDAEKQLRDAADAIKRRREALRANEPMLQAAE